MNHLDFLLPDENFSDALATHITPTLAPYRECFHFRAHDDALLYAELFRNPNATATIVICHGFCEYIGKYAETIYNFFSLGYSVAICEQRGHGFSARQTKNLTKVHIDDFNTYTRDFRYFTAQVSDRLPSLPLILYGHSMGGCIAARYLEQYPAHYCAAILSSPMMEIHPSGIPPQIAMLYARHLLRTGKPDDTIKEAIFDPTPDFEESNTLNRARYDAVFAQRLAEPHYQTSHGTVGWLVCALEGINKTLAHADTIHIPLLLCQAGKDSLVFPDGHDIFLAKAKQATLCKFPRAKHEITASDASTRRDYWKTLALFLRKALAD